ncbi:zinc ABC transporter substrate-binding protein [Metallumcola ferriviriculae]|uniref:Zinc ABC transporter substrate-binding protein n=1 Tax=Metallumcola ferriviriculae TaxID=3039180 RepID=A0AAU0UNR2_9FIRM|nr:zinc ABC transporter substrate-binding protein [Desulfitibacteraceae bacterium MK1]
MILIPMLLLSLVASGCSQRDTAQVGNNDGKMQVFVSFATLAEFTASLGGDLVTVHSLVPSGADAHHWEPSPRDMADLTKAEIFIYNGLNMEPWLDKIKSSVDGPSYIFAGKGMTVTGNEDPHIWLDPILAEAMVRNIARALAEADKANAAAYRQNEESLIARLQQLDGDYQRITRELGQRYLVVSHGAFAHLAARYNLTQVSVLGTNADEMPNPAKMADLVDFCRSKGVTTIYYARGESSRVAETLAEEIGKNMMALDPIEHDIEGEDYFSRMRFNLEQLEQGMSR